MNKYLSFVLDRASRERLLLAVPPLYEKVLADHVTLLYPKWQMEAVAMQRLYLEMVHEVHEVFAISHYIDDDIHAVGVSFNGKQRRLLGGFYHVTISLQGNARAADSNTLTRCVNLDKHVRLQGHIQIST